MMSTSTSTTLQPWEIALGYKGTRFLHMGRSRLHGVDCVGLLVLTFREWGITITDSPAYGREPARNNNSFQLYEYLEQHCGPPVTGQRELYLNDILLIKFRPRFAPSHVALVAPHPHGVGMIHTYAEIGKVVHHRIDDRWNSRIVEVFACPVKS